MKRKKLLSLLLALVLSLTLITPALAAERQSFSDVPPGHWAYDAVEEMNDLGVVNGVGGDRFAPGQTISSAEFITMLVRQFYPEELEGAQGDDGIWWQAYLNAAEAAGALEGTAVQTCFEKDQWDAAAVEAPASRYDMAQMMLNVLKAEGVSLPDAAAMEDARAQIPDYEAIPAPNGNIDYREAVAAMYALGCLQGVDAAGNFNGAAAMDRASACAVLSRLLGQVNGTPETPEVPNQPETPTASGTLADGSAITDDNIRRLINGLRDDYPEGMPWTNDNFYQSVVGMAGYGCAGFAMLCSDAAFGELPLVSSYFDFDSIRVGDMLRINHNTHSVIVLEKKESSVIVAEGNYNSSIHWDREISRQSLEKGEFFGMTRYPA